MTLSILPNRRVAPKIKRKARAVAWFGKGNRVILHGFIMSADMAEESPNSDRIEVLLRIQGVGPGQPRRIVVPFDYLVTNSEFDAEDVVGRNFEAEVEQVGATRWEVSRITVAGRVLRAEE
jgi:hypothetical protein